MILQTSKFTHDPKIIEDYKKLVIELKVLKAKYYYIDYKCDSKPMCDASGSGFRRTMLDYNLGYPGRIGKDYE